MKLETPKDVFLYLSKYLHCYNTSSAKNYKSYFICIVLKNVLSTKKIKLELYNETRLKLINYLSFYAKDFGGFYSQKFNEYLFCSFELKQRKAFLKFIYELELKHEQNNSK
jgi:hypothetical protein